MSVLETCYSVLLKYCGSVSMDLLDLCTGFMYGVYERRVSRFKRSDGCLVLPSGGQSFTLHAQDLFVVMRVGNRERWVWGCRLAPQQQRMRGGGSSGGTSGSGCRDRILLESSLLGISRGICCNRGNQ